MNLSQEALNSINSAYALGVKIEEDRRVVMQQQKIADEQNNFFKRTVEDVVVRNPMIDQLPYDRSTSRTLGSNKRAKCFVDESDRSYERRK